MTQTMKTYLMIGVRIHPSEMPEDVLLNYCKNEENFFDKNTKIEIVQTGVGNDDDDYVVGYIIGNYEEDSDDSIIEKEISFIENFALTVGSIIKRKLDIKSRKARLIMFSNIL